MKTHQIICSLALGSFLLGSASAFANPPKPYVLQVEVTKKSTDPVPYVTGGVTATAGLGILAYPIIDSRRLKSLAKRIRDNEARIAAKAEQIKLEEAQVLDAKKEKDKYMIDGHKQKQYLDHKKQLGEAIDPDDIRKYEDLKARIKGYHDKSYLHRGNLENLSEDLRELKSSKFNLETQRAGLLARRNKKLAVTWGRPLGAFLTLLGGAEIIYGMSKDLRSPEAATGDAAILYGSAEKKLPQKASDKLNPLNVAAGAGAQ